MSALSDGQVEALMRWYDFQSDGDLRGWACPGGEAGVKGHVAALLLEVRRLRAGLAETELLTKLLRADRDRLAAGRLTPGEAEALRDRLFGVSALLVP